MAQKILLRRGPIANLSGAATQQGELLLVTGSLGNLSGPFITMTGTSGTNTSTVVGKIYSGGAAPTLTITNSALTGTPFYSTTDQTLYILDHNGNVNMDITGNLEGRTVSDLTVTTLSGTTVDVSGDISGSNLLLTGNAKIDGNISLGGNINIGDAGTDTITLGGEITSNIIPDVDDTYTVGSATKRFQFNGVNSSISGSFSGSFQGDGSLLTGIPTTLTISDGTATDGVDLLTDTLLFTEASTHGFAFGVTNNTITLSTPQDLRTTATADFADVTIDFWGSVSASLASNLATATSQTLQNVTDNDNSTSNGIVAANNIQIGTTTPDTIDTVGGNLVLASAGGTVTAASDFVVSGNLTVSGTTTTVDSTTVSIGDNIIELNAAGTAADGGIQVQDVVGAASGSGSFLWNATNDYWYAGVSGSTHYRVATFTNASPTSNALPKVDANKRLVASLISDDGTTATIGGNTTVTGTTDLQSSIKVNTPSLVGDPLQATTALFADSSGIVGTIVAADITAVELVGSLGFDSSGRMVASSVVDGGTF